MKSTHLASDDPVEIFLRITHAAKPYFARFAFKPIGLVQERFPKTAKMLLEMALKIVSGAYGEKQQMELTAAMEDTKYPIAKIVELLQDLASQSSISERPEILDQNGLLIRISDIDLEGLGQLFHEYLANLSTTSHLTVRMLLEYEMPQKALDVALSLLHSHEKGKALVEIIVDTLNHHKIDDALKLFDLIPANYERRNVMDRILSELLEDGQIERAIAFGKHFENEAERAHAMQVIAVQLAKNQRLDQGLDLVDKYQQDNQKDYVLSLIVNVLAGKNSFDEAKKIAISIKDRGYRQDAMDAIVKKLVDMRKIVEAQAFVEKLASVKEREEARRIIESAMAAFQRDQRIQQMQKQIGPRVA